MVQDHAAWDTAGRRILMVGAGATGGAFGTRLLEAGREVTYLVRASRAEKLRRDGLRFIAPDGDRTLPVRVITADQDAAPFSAPTPPSSPSSTGCATST